VTNLFEALETAADGVFVINEDLKIVYWNRAAQKMLGFNQSEITDQFCYQVLRGRDEHRRLICRLRCRVAKSAFGGETVANYDVHVHTASGDMRWLNMSIFTYTENTNNREERFVVHLFRDINQKKEDERFLQRVLEVAKRYHDVPPESHAETDASPPIEVLTPREREVLALLAKGHGTQDIAQLLSISPSTVRNHIQHILQKLQVHTRLEAVTYAIKHDLVH
jgi:PAS domain S-box-containing protein